MKAQSKLSASSTAGASALHVNQTCPTATVGPIDDSICTINNLLESLHGSISRAESVFGSVLREPEEQRDQPIAQGESELHSRLAKAEHALRVAIARLDVLADRSTL